MGNNYSYPSSSSYHPQAMSNSYHISLDDLDENSKNNPEEEQKQPDYVVDDQNLSEIESPSLYDSTVEQEESEEEEEESEESEEDVSFSSTLTEHEDEEEEMSDQENMKPKLPQVGKIIVSPPIRRGYLRYIGIDLGMTHLAWTVIDRPVPDDEIQKKQAPNSRTLIHKKCKFHSNGLVSLPEMREGIEQDNYSEAYFTRHHLATRHDGNVKKFLEGKQPRVIAVHPHHPKSPKKKKQRVNLTKKTASKLTIDQASEILEEYLKDIFFQSGPASDAIVSESNSDRVVFVIEQQTAQNHRMMQLQASLRTFLRTCRAGGNLKFHIITRNPKMKFDQFKALQGEINATQQQENPQLFDALPRQQLESTFFQTKNEQDDMKIKLSDSKRKTLRKNDAIQMASFLFEYLTNTNLPNPFRFSTTKTKGRKKPSPKLDDLADSFLLAFFEILRTS
jgi:hypothetical protein